MGPGPVVGEPEVPLREEWDQPVVECHPVEGQTVKEEGDETETDGEENESVIVSVTRVWSSGENVSTRVMT